MTQLSDLQIAAVAYEAGFRGNDLVHAVASAKVESSGDPTVRNSIGASGLWQILQSAHPEFAADWANGDWSNPLRNAQMAFQVFQAGGWAPWNAEGNAWQVNLPAAQTAVSQLAATGFDTNSVMTTPPASGNTGTDAQPVFDPLGTVGSFVSSIFKPLIDDLVDAGLVAGGALMILFGLRLVWKEVS